MGASGNRVRKWGHKYAYKEARVGVERDAEPRRLCCYRNTFENRTEKVNCLNEGRERGTEGKGRGMMRGEGDKQEG